MNNEKLIGPLKKLDYYIQCNYNKNNLIEGDINEYKIHKKVY